MATVGERHSQHGLTRLEQGKQDGAIRLRTRVRLHIDEAAPKELLCAIDRELFDNVHELATAIIALARITFGILVREDRALSLENR